MKLETSAITGSIMSKIVIEVLRGILNRALKETTPKMLTEAIHNDCSIWGETNGAVMGYVQDLPPFISNSVHEARTIVDCQYGGFDTIVMKWLEEDHPLYYNIVKNTPGGKEWLCRQITEILDGVETNASCNKDKVK